MYAALKIAQPRPVAAQSAEIIEFGRHLNQRVLGNSVLASTRLALRHLETVSQGSSEVAEGLNEMQKVSGDVGAAAQRLSDSLTQLQSLLGVFKSEIAEAV